MGLDDLIPEEDRNTSGRSSTSSTEQKQKDPFSNPDLKSIGSPPDDKHFTEQQWNKVSNVIEREFDMSVERVVNNMASQKRHDVLHEAALFNPALAGRSKYFAGETCVVCDTACKNTITVELSGCGVCEEHTAGEVKQAIEENNDG